MKTINLVRFNFNTKKRKTFQSVKARKVNIIANANNDSTQQFYNRTYKHSSENQTLEERLDYLEYIVKIQSSKIEHMEEHIKTQNVLITEMQKNHTLSQGTVINQIRDMGLICLDMDFVKDNLDTILKYIHH